jgi:membrane protein YdbS with pleckstrin-like domain
MKQKAKICALPWLMPYVIASVIFAPIAVATISPTHGLMLLAWVMIVFIALIHTFVLRLGRQVYITDHAVGFKTGIFRKDVTEMSLSKIGNNRSPPVYGRPDVRLRHSAISRDRRQQRLYAAY